jgi:hypothetical protein
MGTDELTKGSDSPDVRNLPLKSSSISHQGASSCDVPPRELPELANLWGRRGSDVCDYICMQASAAKDQTVWGHRKEVQNVWGRGGSSYTGGIEHNQCTRLHQAGGNFDQGLNTAKAQNTPTKVNLT